MTNTPDTITAMRKFILTLNDPDARQRMAEYLADERHEADLNAFMDLYFMLEFVDKRRVRITYGEDA